MPRTVRLTTTLCGDLNARFKLLKATPGHRGQVQNRTIFANASDTATLAWCRHRATASRDSARHRMRAALPRGLRMALLTAHITAAALWLGRDTALIAVTAAHTAIPAPLGAAVLRSSAAITLGTGLVLGAHRPWGLRRHHWIVAKVQISAVVAAAGLTSLSGFLDPGRCWPRGSAD